MFVITTILIKSSENRGISLHKSIRNISNTLWKDLTSVLWKYSPPIVKNNLTPIL